MQWFNVWGLIFLVIIMIPNALYAAKCKDGFENKQPYPFAEKVEQIGRYGCFGLMVVNIPGTYFGFWSDRAFILYLVMGAVLTAAYCLIWAICFRKNSVFRAIALSVLPSVLFLLSGILSRSVLLILSAVLFAPSHIYISYKNAD